MITLASLVEHMEKNATTLNALESYSNWDWPDSSNLGKVKVGETLGRLSFANVSVLKKISSVGGKALFEKKEDVDSSIETRILIWFMFKFEQDGRQIKVSNLSLGTSFMASSMTNARQIIRENYPE